MAQGADTQDPFKSLTQQPAAAPTADPALAAPAAKPSGAYYNDLNTAWENKPEDWQNYNLFSDNNGVFWASKAAPQSKDAAPVPGDGSIDKLIDTYRRGRTDGVGQQIKDFAYNVGGPGFNRGLANTLGAPVDIVTLGVNHLLGATGVKPIEDPIGGSENLRNVAALAGIGTTPEEKTTGQYFGSKIGEFLGSSAPFMAMPLVKALMTPEHILANARTGTASLPAVQNAARSPLKSTITEAELAASAGSGAAIGGEVSGRTNPESQAVGELLGSFGLGWRGPIAAALSGTIRKGALTAAGLFGYKGSGAQDERAAAGILSDTATNPEGVKSALANAGENFVPGHALTTGSLTGDQALMSLEAQTIRKNAETHADYLSSLDQTQAAMRSSAKFLANPQQAVAEVLQDRLLAALDKSKTRLAALGGTDDPIMAARNSEAASKIVRQELWEAQSDANASEAAVWNSVNRDQPRSYDATQSLFKQMAADFEQSPLRSPEDFPAYLKPLVLGEGTAAKKTGLSQLDTLGNGQDLRSRILQDIRVEQAKDAPNRPLLGYLGKIQSQLLEDMGGSDLNQDPALRNALAFSRAKNAVFNSPEVSTAMASNKRGAERVGDAMALETFLKQGPRGADALDNLIGASQYRFGTDGPGSMLAAAQDVMKQKFVSEVAGPNGYVSPADYERFKEKYANILARWPQLTKQFDDAVSSEGEVQKLIGSKPMLTPEVRRSRMELYLDNPPGVAAEYAFNSPNQYAATKQILAQLRDDPTGAAAKGFAQLTAEKMFADNLIRERKMGGELRLNGNAKNGIPAWLATNSGVIRAIDEEVPGFADNMRRIGNTAAGFERQFVNPGVNVQQAQQKMNFLTDLFGALVGAKMGQHLAGSGFGSSMVMAGRGSELVRGQLENVLKLGPAKVSRIVAAALADPEYYQEITRDYSDPAKAPAAIHGLHAFFGAMGIPSNYGPATPQATVK